MSKKVRREEYEIWKTLSMKSGGVPGLTVGRTTPSWWEWIRVSSRSSTRTCKYESHVIFLEYSFFFLTFFRTMLSLCLEMGERGEMSYLMALYCWI